MASPGPTSLRVAAGAIDVSALLHAPPAARACYVLAHGAGAGMTHPFMAAVASGLAERGIATLRYQFPFMQAGSSPQPATTSSSPAPSATTGSGSK